jgi:hypothetical protein
LPLELLATLAIRYDDVSAERERAMKRRRMRDVRRYDRQLAGMTGDLLRLQQQLRAIADAQPRDLSDWTRLLSTPEEKTQ